MIEYTLTMDTETSFLARVGNYSINCSFVWPISTQEQYDLITSQITEDRDREPLVGTNTINRDYDLLDYYVNQMPDSLSLFRIWWDEQEVKPQSLSSSSSLLASPIMFERKETYKAVKEMLDLWEETLVWQCVMDDGISTTVASVRPGGWNRNQDTSWCFRFVCEEPEVTRDNISTVTIEFEVNE